MNLFKAYFHLSCILIRASSRWLVWMEVKKVWEWLKVELILRDRCQRNPHTIRVVNVHSPKASIWSGTNETPKLKHLNYLAHQQLALTHTCHARTFVSFSLTHSLTSLSQGKKGPFRWTVEYFWRFVLWSLPPSPSLTSVRLITSNRCQAGHIEPRFQFP